MYNETEEIRQKLLNEIGPGMIYNPAMIMEVIAIEHADENKLRQIADQYSVDLSEFDGYSLERKY